MQRLGGLTVLRAGERYRTDLPGVRSWHCFSAGSHYDPDNLSFGSVLGVDEHLVEPGAGFDWHAHRGVEIVSFVLDGVLRHESDTDERLVSQGELLRQDASDGLRHRETNGGDTPLRFVQTTWLGGTGTSLDLVHGAARVSAPRAHLFVARGAFGCNSGPADDGVALRAGDSVRADGLVTLSGSGAVLVVRLAR
jgi:mannose-6-phosphate isomerase-like protein (cupin superfamily)